MSARAKALRWEDARERLRRVAEGTAVSIDVTASIAGRLALLISGVVAVSMLLLLVAFRSVVIVFAWLVTVFWRFFTFVLRAANWAGVTAFEVAGAADAELAVMPRPTTRTATSVRRFMPAPSVCLE